VKKRTQQLVLAVALAVTASAFAARADAAPLTMDDFHSATTDGIVKLCSAPESDPLYQGAIGYCVGYLTGAFHFYRMTETPKSKLVCFKTAEPSRREEIARFVEWAKAHPQYGAMPAVDTMFRYLGEAFPCS
jgi:hypothetical protein